MRGALTVCEVCDTTTDETVAEHLAMYHENRFFEIDQDPSTGSGVIHREVSSASSAVVERPTGFFNKFGG